ncbi:MAG: hypothetical protein ACLSVD_14415 [Eggerthellaceae bacterium]
MGEDRMRALEEGVDAARSSREALDGLLSARSAPSSAYKGAHRRPPDAWTPHHEIAHGRRHPACTRAQSDEQWWPRGWA